MTPEEMLLTREKLAATLGTQECQEVLKARRESIIDRIKNSAPTQNDPNCFIIHYRAGELQAIDDLIALGKNATTPQNKGTQNGTKRTTKHLPTF